LANNLWEKIVYYNVFFLCHREYKVEISDRAFHPPVLLIETGDRVWWYWDKYKVGRTNVTVSHNIECIVKVTATIRKLTQSP
jgi:hypothetical protein